MGEVAEEAEYVHGGACVGGEGVAGRQTVTVMAVTRLCARRVATRGGMTVFADNAGCGTPPPAAAAFIIIVAAARLSTWHPSCKWRAGRKEGRTHGPG